MLPKFARQYQPDLIWGLGNFGLPNPPCPQAFLLHMPQFLYGPQHARLPVGRAGSVKSDAQTNGQIAAVNATRLLSNTHDGSAIFRSVSLLRRSGNYAERNFAIRRTFVRFMSSGVPEIPRENHFVLPVEILSP